MNGLAPAARHRPARRTGGVLTRHQRLVVTCVASALGLMCARAWSQSGGIPVEPAAAEGAGSGVAAMEAAAQAGAAVQLKKKEHAKQEPTKHSRKDGASGTIAGGAIAGAAAADKQAGATQQRGAEAGQQHKQQQQKQQKQQQAGGQQHKGGQHAAQHMVHPGMVDEPQWFAKLSSKGCRNAEELRVCSHRGKLEVEGVAPGSVTAYATLVKAGVSCFDIDFVLTSDGSLLATHPDDLQAAVDRAGSGAGSGAAGGTGLSNLSGHVHDFSLADLRAAGADEERFPTADTLIKVFAAALESAGLLWHPGQGVDEPNYDQLPVLLMDLKGPAYSPDVIDGVAAAAQAAAATAHVALFVASEGQRQLVQGTKWKGPLIRAYMDREDPNPKMSAEALAPFTLLGPSIKMSDAFFSAAAQLGKPILAWTADTPAELHRAAEAKLNAVVSNRPIALRAVLMDWRDRCSERQRRQRQQRRALRGAGAGGGAGR